MSEVQTDQAINEEVSTPSVEELQQELSNRNKEFESVKSKMDQLLDETKKAKAAKKEAEAAIKLEAEAKARKEGDFEQLLKSSEDERNRLSSELDALRTGINSEKINTEALKLASELADGPNAEILSEFIKQRIQYTQDGLKVTDTSGNLTIASIDQLKQEFANSEKFKSLLRGNKSTGGGATGSSDSVAVGNSRTADEIRAMDSLERGKFFQNGGQIRNEV